MLKFNLQIFEKSAANRFVLASFFLLIATFGAVAQSFSGQLEATPPSVLEDYFYQANVYQIDATSLKNWLLNQPNRTATINLSLGNEYDFELNIAPANLVKLGTMVTLADENSRKEVPFTYDPTYKGAQTNGYGRFALVINDHHIEGAIEQNHDFINIQPLRIYDTSAPADYFIVYKNGDVKPTAPMICGTKAAENKAIQLEKEHGHDEPTAESAILACYQVDLAVASASTMLASHGGSAIGVQNHILGVLNLVNVLFTGNFNHDLDFVVTDWYNSLNAGGDAWGQSTNSGTLLNNFTAWGQGGNFGSTYDLAELWDHTTWQSGVVGIAWLSALCTGNRYHAISDFTTNMCFLQVVVAHEIGHNLSCQHDASGSSFVMAPAVNCTDNWSSTSVSSVNSYLPSKINSNCLTACAGGPLPPVAAFAFTPASPVCQGAEVFFDDNSTNTPTTWAWIFPSGTPATSSAQNPTVVWNVGGTFQVKLTVTNSGGSSMTTKNITVNPLPNPAFTFTTNGKTATFNANATTNGLTYFWDFGDGTTSSLKNPMHTYVDDGLYLVTLAVTNNCGTITLSKDVEIATPPIADFAGAPTSGCAPMTVSYQSLASNNTTSWSWNFPGGFPSSSGQQNPMVVYNNPGTYSVTLTVFNSVGQNSKIRTNYIVVGTTPTPSFFTTINQNVVNFTNTSTGGATSYLWNFGDGQTSILQNPIHTYQSGGNFTVTLTATNACGSEISSETITIATLPTAAFSGSPTSGCAPLTVNFTNNSTGATTYFWTFTGGNPATSTAQNPAVVYSNAGLFSVKLKVCNPLGCDSLTKTNFVSVNAAPAASFTSTLNGSTANFSNNSTIATSFLWNFGDSQTSTAQNPSHTYATDGNFTVTLSATNVCGTTVFTKIVSIVTPVTAGFGAAPTTGCAGLAVNFTSQSSANVTGWNWTFSGGNPSTSTAQNPSVTYAQSGIYGVTLTVSNSQFSNTFTQSNFINITPAATSSFTNSTNGFVASFTNNSTNATSFLWNFGDSQTSTAQNPSHAYASDGNYTVTLSATNACGTVVSTQTLSIVTPVTAAFSASNSAGCPGLSVNFTSQSSPNVTSWNWTFSGGNPATSTAQNPTVTYAQSGSYAVILTVSNSQFSNTTTQSNFVTISPLPTAAFTASSVGNTVTFTNNSTNSASFLWNFSDNTSSTAQNPVHTFPSDGNWSATLTATNNCGTNVVTQAISLNTPPMAAFLANPAAGCEPLTVNFVNQSSANANSFAWTFSGGNPASSTVQNPIVTYAQSGTYQVSLTVTNSVGSSTTSSEVLVNPLATAGFTHSTNGLSASFSNNSTNSTSFFWNFGDGQNSTAQNPTHVYAADGNYSVILIATNGCGSANSTQSVVIATPPTSVFSASQTTGCAPFLVNFTNQSSANSNSFNWTFPGGNPATSNAENPSVTYAQSGSYVATLTVSNNAGSATSTATMTVLGQPTANFTSQTVGLLVNFTNNSSNSSTYLWNFGDGTNSTEANPTHTFATEGNYSVVLTATNTCGSVDFVQNFVLVLPPTANFSNSNSTGCASFVINFFNQSSANSTTLQWFFPGGNPTTSNGQNPTVNYVQSGIYGVILTVTNAAGTSTFSQPGLVQIGLPPTPIFTTQTAGLSVICSNLSLGTGNSYLWDFGDASPNSTEVNPEHTYANTGTYSVTLIAINNCGALTVSSEVIISGSAPIPTFTNTNSVGCTPLSVQYSDASPGNPTAWAWQFAGGFPASSTEQNPTVVYSTAGTYDVTLNVTNIFGNASQTFPQLVQIAEPPVVGFVYLTGANYSVNFNNLTSNAASFLWNFGDGATSTEQNPTHDYANFGTYMVTLTATNLCASNSVQQTIDLLVGTKEADWLSKMQLYPNPTSGEMTLELSGIAGDNLQISVLDLLGRVVFDPKSIDFSTGQLKQSLDLSYLPTASYILRLSNGAKTANIKVAIQR